MTEAEWLACTEPEAIWLQLRGRCSDRKLRLWACGCCRWLCGNIVPKVINRAIGGAERLAEGDLDEDEAEEIENETKGALANSDRREAEVACWLLHPQGWKAARMVEWVATTADGRWMTAIQRDIFGNPFRPVAADPSWLTSTVLALARGIYADRAFDRLPILADALQDAGCDNEDVLDHCRGPGPHARGCWVVDLLLGKS
jgi:hypothetical protein